MNLLKIFYLILFYLNNLIYNFLINIHESPGYIFLIDKKHNNIKDYSKIIIEKCQQEIKL
jgi:hypothetical protein